jgi:CoA-dependent NAD(P)H sulfur oxidoreductase
MPPPHIIVVGGVAAGPAAAAEAARADPEARVTLYEQGPTISYGACEIPYYVAGALESAESLVAFTPERFRKERGVSACIEHRVEEIDPERNHLFVRNLRSDESHRVRYDKLVIATGAKPRVPRIAGVDAENVFPIRRLDEAEALRNYLDRHPVRHAVVIGGGYIGVEMAEALVERGVRATILEPQGGLLNRYLSPSMRRRFEEVVLARGVIIRDESAEGLDVGTDGRVRAVHTDRGEKIGCQAVLICIGVVPDTALPLAAGARLGSSGALAVDDSMRTNLPAIWACGDVVEVRRVIDDRMVHLPLSPVAFRTARVAGRNAARRGRGRPQRFGGVCDASAVRVFGCEVGVAGLREVDAFDAGIDCTSVEITHTSRSSRYPGSSPITVRLVGERGSGRLLGVEIVGSDGAALRTNVLVPLLHAGARVKDLLELDLVYNPPIAPPRDPLLIAASALAKKIDAPISRGGARGR